MPAFVDVAVPVGVRRTFAYGVPRRMRDGVRVGARVLVPFGRRVMTGIVASCSDEAPTGPFKLREIRELLDQEPLIPVALVEVGLWAAAQYYAPPGEVLRALFPAGTGISAEGRFRLSDRARQFLSGGLLPPGLTSSEERLLRVIDREGSLSLSQLEQNPEVRQARKAADSLLRSGLLVEDAEVPRARVGAKALLGIRARRADEGLSIQLPPAQLRLYSRLSSLSGSSLLLQDALKQAGTSLATARELERKGLVDIFPTAMERLPADLDGAVARREVTLTPDQEFALRELKLLLERREPARSLLHGVTGSGKTEVYLRLVAEALRLGGTVLYLVPEISLTPLLSRIAVSHFPDKVALLHSGMSQGERFDQWHRIRKGLAPVVVGTRSAVFAPLEDLRLVILDEEQDTSYKQDESPCYHAREVAWKRCRQSGGLLVMGSATPSIETFHAARETGEVVYLRLPCRVEDRPLPDVTIVDMGIEFQRHGKRTILSADLREDLDTRLKRGEQAILLLNRRGYSRSLLCRSCGHVSLCADCSVALTYHQDSHRLACHYCGAEKQVPSRCSECGGEFIYFVGVGTEQLEEIVRKAFPRARMARLDRDSVRRRGVLRRTLLDFGAGKLDLLVGTQMLAKGHDFPNVTLVGVVAADSGLAFPDFRSAERTFQLLTQVAGRAGRGDAPGKVVIQSFYPDHYALRLARRQDYFGFFEQEIEFRRQLGYPPFTRLVQFLVSDPHEPKALQIGEKVAGALRNCVAREDAGRIRVLGPASAPLEKLKGQYRIQVLIKSYAGADPLPLVHAAFETLARQKMPLRKIHVDIDPQSML